MKNKKSYSINAYVYDKGELICFESQSKDSLDEMMEIAKSYMKSGFKEIRIVNNTVDENSPMQ